MVLSKFYDQLKKISRGVEAAYDEPRDNGPVHDVRFEDRIAQLQVDDTTAVASIVGTTQTDYYRDFANRCVRGAFASSALSGLSMNSELNHLTMVELDYCKGQLDTDAISKL